MKQVIVNKIVFFYIREFCLFNFFLLLLTKVMDQKVTLTLSQVLPQAVGPGMVAGAEIKPLIESLP